MREQENWDEHAAFMDALVDDGFVVLGGPLGDRLKFLLIINAESEQEIDARLTDDPWTSMGLLRIARSSAGRSCLGHLATSERARGGRRLLELESE